MEQEWAKRWVRALVSGRYPQTKHCLRDGIGYDPVGVLADISGLGYYADVAVEDGDEDKPRGFLLYDDGDEAPPTVIGQLENLAGIRFDSIGKLADMNDRGVPFNELAGYIAQNWEQL
ncbi:MAG: hypothetical protein JOZ16_10470 [Methylobacteriaceae bacterium]|nr:hypothetical protein [Methylobacteriaceae bacterium]